MIRLSYRWDTSGDMRMLTDLLSVVVARTNIAGIVLRLRYGGAWVAVTTSGYDSFSCTRSGRGVYVDTAGGVSGSHLWHRDELAGAGVSILSGGNLWVGKVARNRPGSTAFAAGVTTLQLALELEDATGAPASGTCYLWPRTVAWDVRPSAYSRDIQGFQLRIPVYAANVAPGNPSDTWIELGEVFAGQAHLWSWAPSQDRSEEEEVQAEISEADDGTTVVRQLGPGRRRWTVHLSDPVPGRNIYLSTSPDYVRSATGGDPTALYQDVARDLLDLVRSIGGPLTPVVFRPRYTLGTPGGFTRRLVDVIPAQVRSLAVSRDQRGGYDDYSHVDALDGLEIVERV